MKYYKLSCIMNKHIVCIPRRFKSRNAAINYMFKKLPSTTQLDYENEISKHNIEYVCNDYSRFYINRCLA